MGLVLSDIVRLKIRRFLHENAETCLTIKNSLISTAKARFEFIKIILLLDKI